MSQVANRTSKQHFDVQLCLYAYALAIFGVIAVTAATYTGDGSAVVTTLFARIASSYHGQWQGIFLLISPLVIGAMMAVDYRILGKLSFVFFLGSCAMLVLVLFTNAISGVRGWFTFVLDRTIQPSELAKIAVIIHLAGMLSKKENPISSFRDFFHMAIIIGIPVTLILAQGEMGSAVVFIVFFMAMILIAGVDVKIILGILLAGIAVVIPAVLFMRAMGSYRFDRIIGFLDPSQVSSDITYQQDNSKIAVGSGGVYGQGLFQEGSLSALNFVPEDHTDFIFSAIGESMGFMGCAGLILLYTLLIGRMIVLAINTADPFGRLIIVGVASMMLYHVMQAVGMSIGVMPVMGIPLPFVSYGGSNLTANMAGIGLVLNVTMRKPQPRLENAPNQPLKRRKPPRHAAGMERQRHA